MTKDAKKTIRVLLVSAFFLFIIVYAFFRFYSLIFGIQIKDVNIETGETITESPFLIQGKAKNAVMLKLNGREIQIDKEGNFKEWIALFPGYNIIDIEAKDKFGHTDQEDYKLIH